MRTPRVFQAFVLLAVVSHMTSAKEPPPRKVEKPAVTISTAVLDKSGNLLVNYMVYKSVTTVRIVKKGDREIKERVIRTVPETRTMIIAKGRFQVFDAKGMKVASMALQQLLKTKKVILVTGNGMKPTEQIKKLDGNTLLVVKLSNKPPPKKD